MALVTGGYVYLKPSGAYIDWSMPGMVMEYPPVGEDADMACVRWLGWPTPELVPTIRLHIATGIEATDAADAFGIAA